MTKNMSFILKILIGFQGLKVFLSRIQTSVTAQKY